MGLVYRLYSPNLTKDPIHALADALSNGKLSPGAVMKLVQPHMKTGSAATVPPPDSMTKRPLSPKAATPPAEKRQKSDGDKDPAPRSI